MKILEEFLEKFSKIEAGVPDGTHGNQTNRILQEIYAELVVAISVVCPAEISLKIPGAIFNFFLSQCTRSHVNMPKQDKLRRLFPNFFDFEVFCFTFGYAMSHGFPEWLQLRYGITSDEPVFLILFMITLN